MKKYLLVSLLALFMASNVGAFTLQFNIPDESKDIFIHDFISEHENKETIDDPACSALEKECKQVPKYTDEEWVKERIGRWINSQIKEGRKTFNKKQQKKPDYLKIN